MIKNRQLLKKWHREYLAKTPPDFFQNLQIFESLYKEAQYLGVLPTKDPLEGIDFKIKFARSLNVSGIAKKTGKGA